jgi:hypothetical protein
MEIWDYITIGGGVFVALFQLILTIKNCKEARKIKKECKEIIDDIKKTR